MVLLVSIMLFGIIYATNTKQELQDRRRTRMGRIPSHRRRHLPTTTHRPQIRRNLLIEWAETVYERQRQTKKSFTYEKTATIAAALITNNL